ncbi:protein-methionine sulfoxide oxidase mical3a isoform X3 [Megalops cyprinoides]|uniref:protein-methionine sulfoxide oxidase mical3a isoform X3 n=1 Tax=Megalops cyprinoides TaxID=118141 RepID=UPI001864F9F2|nr:protein-methionine sulfoxide oxidase mical3a isoform X3 [Megalops cyprinoides]
MGDRGVNGGGERVNHSHVLFDRFVQASTCKGTLKAFQELCDFLELKPNEYRVFYHKLKSKLNYWKAKALWAKLDKRACHRDYKKGRACANSKCLIIGAGPCGLRTAIELGFLGAKVVLLEKRDAFSRNNVLHLWPFTIQDLRGLGAKKFYGKFCAGSIDHISIRQLQLMLLKVALLLGIEIHVNVEFKGLIEPPEDQENERVGWRAEVHPCTHPVSELQFDVIIGADGRRNTLPGFRRKEFRGKLAIAITANFINRNTTAEAKVEEISGVAFIFNQKFFQDLREATGIDLENIVYYKDDTHYFVMTAKKQSLLEKGVILHDYVDTELLLSRGNVDQAALLSYAREAADFSTSHQLPTLDFAINHYGQPDVAMFDFTCMYASENAALVRQRNGHQLLVALVGDSLLEPFWPMGTGIARGFLAAMDSAWMVRSWAQGICPLEVLAERESIYRLLPQTTPENVSKNFSQYSIDPTTRYPNISLHLLRPNQVRHLIDTGESRDLCIDMERVVNASTPRVGRNESIARSSKLLSWCQRQTEGYRGVAVTDLTMSWKSGLALCALIHRYRPDLIDFVSLEESDTERNNQLGFDMAEREFGISPIMTGQEMSFVPEPDKLSMVMYLSQFYEMFKDTVPPGENRNLSPEERAALIASTKSPISFLSKLGQSISRKRNPKDKKEKDADVAGKRRKTSQAGQSEDEEVSRSHRDDQPSLGHTLRAEAATGANSNKVKSMATQLLAKFEDNTPVQSSGLRRQGDSMPNMDFLRCPSLPPVPLKSSACLAPFPAWRQARTNSASRCCPKKTIVLSSTCSSLSLHSQSSLRKEFPQNIGGSDVCFFCRKRVYVMERLSAEGKFFHRSCFQCDYCGTTLRLSSYAFDVEDGKFYCKPHYCYRLSGQAQRKRPAPTGVLPATKEKQAPVPAPAPMDDPGRVADAAALVELRPSAVEVNGLQEPSLAKRLRGTPERIELENYRVCLQREEELEEVPEETLAEHNLSSILDKATDVEEGSSSSESEIEEEDEQQPAAEDLGGGAWNDTVELPPQLRQEGNTGGEEEGGVDTNITGDAVEEEEEEEEQEGEEDKEEEEEESSDARNLRVQQVVQPVDPLAAQTYPNWTHIQSEGASASQPSCSTVTAQASARLEAVRAWLDSVSGESCDEDGDPEAEAGSPDMEPGTELDDEDIASDAEAEARLQQLEDGELPEDGGTSENQGRVSSLAQSSMSAEQSGRDDAIFLDRDAREIDAKVSSKAPMSLPFLVKSSDMHLSLKTLEVDEAELLKTSETLAAKSPLTAATAGPPICLPPVSIPETAMMESSVETQPCTCSPAGNPLSPICSQPLPCKEPSTPTLLDSPVRTQPVPAVTSTPLTNPTAEKSTTNPQRPPDLAAEIPVKREDIIQEFWMKSAEIRKSLGLSPLERSRVLEKSLKAPTPDSSSSPRSYTPDDLSEELKPPFMGRSIIRRLNITVEGQVISPINMGSKSSGSEKRDLSSSSGLGLNGSVVTSQAAASESFNTSDSAMLTPPSSPPPATPKEETTSLKLKKHQAAWNIQPESTPVLLQVPTPAPEATPMPASRTVPVTAVVVKRETSKPRREEVRKSFIESMEEIPFADDVEDTYDDQTPDTSLQERLLTPSAIANKDKPPLHLALAMENGRPNISTGLASIRQQGASEFSPEAKEVTEERLRAREKSVKSQVLKDAMAKQRTKMKETEMPKGRLHKVAWNIPTEQSGRSKSPPTPSFPKTSAGKALESQKQAEVLPERLSTNQGSRSLEGSASSSEVSGGVKSKKRSSLFSPRKNKKEKKAKSEGQLSDKHGSEDMPKHKSLWKVVFSGYKKDKKKKDDKPLSSIPLSAATVDSGKRRSSPLGKSTDLHLQRNLSFSEDSDLSCDDVLERSSQKSKADSVYVPHALAFKKVYALKKAYTEEELNAKLTRKVQKAARRQAKQEELKRLHRAQIIQRQLEQVEEKQRQLEERGVAVEKALRGEADYWGESNYSEILDLHLGGMGKKDDPKLMQEWFKLVQEKNALVRYESELMIFARELELEDRQSRLQQELRERMAVDDHLKTEKELAEEKQILNEMLEVVEQRDSLVALLEEQRLREKEEDKDLEAVMLSKGFNLNWA